MGLVNPIIAMAVGGGLGFCGAVLIADFCSKPIEKSHDNYGAAAVGDLGFGIMTTCIQIGIGVVVGVFSGAIINKHL